MFGVGCFLLEVEVFVGVLGVEVLGVEVFVKVLGV